MSKKTVSNINDTTLTENLLVPDRKLEEDNVRIFLDRFQEIFTILIQPEPGVCVKTKTCDGKKAFINICATPELPPPPYIDMSDIELLQALNDPKGTISMPVSVGPKHMEVDKEGLRCMTYDVVFNSTFLEKCKKNSFFMTYCVSIAMQVILRKYQMDLSEDYVILKNRKQVGQLQPRRIRKCQVDKPPKKLIEEIPVPKKQKSVIKSETDKLETKKSETDSLETNRLETDKLVTKKSETDNLGTKKSEIDSLKSKKSETDSLETKKSKIDKLEADELETKKVEPEKSTTDKLEIEKTDANYVILKEPRKGESKRLIGLFFLPRRVTSEEVSVFLGTNRIVVTVDHLRFMQDITVAFKINKKATEVLLDRDMKVLRLNMPVIKGL